MPSLPYSLEALLLGTKRSISPDDGGSDTIIPDVVISEEHTDEVTLTKHPVDVGADVTDHAFVQPAVLRCQFGWSQSSILVNSLLSGSILKGVTTTQEVYASLLRMMQSREVLTVSTGKRNYGRMLITKLHTVTTVDTESALVVDVTFEQILTARATSVEMETAAMQDPAATGGTKNTGTAAPVISRR